MAERDHHRPGQGGEVDDCRGLDVALRPGSRTQHQPAFCVSVNHFDRPARHGGDDVARPQALPSGIFSTSPQTPTTLALALRPASALSSPTTAPAPPCPHFIASTLGRLDRDAAGIKGHASLLTRARPARRRPCRRSISSPAVGARGPTPWATPSSAPSAVGHFVGKNLDLGPRPLTLSL